MEKFFVCLLSCALMLVTASSVHAREVNSQSEIQCIARTIHGEARGESTKGQIYVGLVIRARATDPKHRWPRTMCGVARQSGQFYGYCSNCDPSPEIEAIARNIYSGGYSFPRGWECVRYFDSKHRSFMTEVGWVGGHVFGCAVSD